MGLLRMSSRTHPAQRVGGQQHRHADQARDAMEMVRSASFMMRGF